jgi:MFS family permease
MSVSSRRWSWLPPSVWLLGVISLLTDTASEAIYPLLPMFLTAVLGARPLALGLIEGVAEATSSVLKIVAGRASDRSGRRRPWVVAGYTLSSLVRPLMAFVTGWGQVFALRFIDRVGKGVRSAPRDAWLASMAAADARARVFSFHRAMDHTGAILGPVVAAALLWLWPGAFRAVFFATLLPGLAVVALLLRLPRDPGPASRVDEGGASPTAIGENDSAALPPPAMSRRAGHDGPAGAVRLPGSFVRILTVILVFTLGNSTDAYLLLRLTDSGVPPALVPLAWAALHLVKASSSFVGGAVADRWGRRVAIGSGWAIYAAVYAGFATVSAPAALTALFLVYGVHYGLCEGPERALVADVVDPARRGLAFGLYNAALGFGALAASLVFGLLWEAFGPPAAFWTGAGLALAAVGLLWALVPETNRVAPAA